MRKFTLKPDLSFAVIPGTGRIVPKQVLEGEQYARFVPSLLVELLEEPKAAPPVPPPPPPAPLSVETPFEGPVKEEPEAESKPKASSSSKKTSSKK